jgi:putative endonuclease
MINQTWYLSMLSNYSRNVFYVGITHYLPGRLKNHRIRKDSNFAPKYNLHSPVYYEKLQDKWHALVREKQLTNWHRKWKIALIRKTCPDMRHLSAEVPGRRMGPD